MAWILEIGKEVFNLEVAMRILLLCLIILVEILVWLCTSTAVATVATVVLFFMALIVIFYDNNKFDWSSIDLSTDFWE